MLLGRPRRGSLDQFLVFFLKNAYLFSVNKELASSFCRGHAAWLLLFHGFSWSLSLALCLLAAAQLLKKIERHIICHFYGLLYHILSYIFHGISWVNLLI